MCHLSVGYRKFAFYIFISIPWKTIDQNQVIIGERDGKVDFNVLSCGLLFVIAVKGTNTRIRNPNLNLAK